MRLYPGPQHRSALRGLYLNLNLHRQAASGDVLIYANFIASVDGRISAPQARSDEFIPPASITNRRDWRLYQELAAQADVIIVSARYFRQLARGCAQARLPVASEPEYADLLDWRRMNGFKAQPDVLVLSNSLDIPPQALQQAQDRDITICTCEQADSERAAQLQERGVALVTGGRKTVEGKALRRLLIDRSYRSACMIAGPQVHQTLVAQRVLDRLFLTTHLSLLGGDAFHTILAGKSGAAVRLQLQSLYLDQQKTGAQLFAQYRL